MAIETQSIRCVMNVMNSLVPNCRKRRREATPPEALSPGKEAKIAKCEAEEAARSEAQDPLWR